MNMVWITYENTATGTLHRRARSPRAAIEFILRAEDYGYIELVSVENARTGAKLGARELSLHSLIRYIGTYEPDWLDIMANGTVEFDHDEVEAMRAEDEQAHWND